MNNTKSGPSFQLQNAQQDSIFQIQLNFLEFLKKNMIPHQKLYNIIDLFQIIINYSIKLPNHTFQAAIVKLLNETQSLDIKQRLEKNQKQNQEEVNKLMSKKKSINIQKIQEQQLAIQIKQRKVKYAQQILDKIKSVFLWYKKNTVSYEMINNYVLSCQNRTLKQNNSLQNLSQYQNLPQRRIRLDQNVKLCIMPQGDSSKIKFLSINPQQQINQDIYRKQIFVVTSQYARSIRVDAEKLAKQGNKTVKVQQSENEKISKINIVKNWYTYSETKILPQNSNSGEKDMKINAKKQIYIQKIAISENLIGIISHEKDVLVQPIIRESQKYQRGRKVVPYQIRMGNLLYDIPDENLQKPLRQDKAKQQELQKGKILIFQCYNDNIWIIVTQYFIFVYILPSPESNQIVNDEIQKSALLSLCEPLPIKCHQAKLLTNQYLAVMLQSPVVIILKLQLSSKKQEMQKNRIYPTNKIYNDIKFICMDYHIVDRYLIFTDFGGYLVRLKFNIYNGDIQRQGAVYNGEMGKFITQNTTNTRRDKQFNALKRQSQLNIQNSLVNLQNKQQNGSLNSQLKNQTKTALFYGDSLKTSQKKHTLTIWQNKGSSVNQINASEINIGTMKDKKQINSNDKSGMSIYAKPQNTDHMKIVKNSSRQNMILICLNKNTSTLITYEQMSVNPLKNGKSQDNQPADKDRLYDKTIKLWDINYMNVYQTFRLSLQICDLSLQSNGLYIVTKQRGYLGFYPLLSRQQHENVEKKEKRKNRQKQRISKFGQNIVINGNQLFFYIEQIRQKDYKKIQQEGYENHLLNYNNAITTLYNLSFSKEYQPMMNLQEIPSQISSMQVQNKMYVLGDTNGDKKYNLHIYDMLGNKQSILKGMHRTQKYGIIQNYNNIKRINHFQFNILMWNKHSLKFVGSNLQQSYTIHWTLSCNKERMQNKTLISQFDFRSMKSSLSKKDKSIEQIYIGQHSIGVQQKLNNDVFKNVSLSIVHLETGKIKYRVNDIRNNFKVLEIHNNIIMSHETVTYKSATNTQVIDQLQTGRRSNFRSQYSKNDSQKISMPNQDQEIINLYDVNSPLNRKCFFTLKFKTMVEKNINPLQISEIFPEFNTVLNHDKFFTRKHISFQKGRIFGLNNDNSIIVSCIFKLKHQTIQKLNQNSLNPDKVKIYHSQEKYFLYSKQITSQVANKLKYIPRTSDQNIAKISKKVNFEYSGQSETHQRILGHWQIDLEDLINRSTTKNFNYLSDFHSDIDDNIQIIAEDITQKIIKFSEQQKYHQNFLAYNQTIIKIYEKIDQKLGNDDCKIDISWILAQTKKQNSLICLSSQSFFQIYSQQLSCGDLASVRRSDENYQIPKLQVSLQKLCKIEINEAQKPMVIFWNDNYSLQNKRIWEQTKKQLIEYSKAKLSKQSQVQLNSPSNISKKCVSNGNQNSSIIKLKQSNQSDQIQTSKLKDSISSQSKKQTTSNQLNNMFRQWHINKNIQKEMKQYQKNSSEAKKQLNKEMKNIIQNPSLKQERIKFLLSFPQQIKDPKINKAYQIIAKKFNFLNGSNDIFSLFSKNIQKSISKERQMKNQRSVEKLKQLQTALQKSIQSKLKSSLQNSISLPKIASSVLQMKSIKQEKKKQTKSNKHDTKSESKKELTSSLSSINYEFVSPKMRRNDTKGFQSSTFKYSRTKTQQIDSNYLKHISQTPLMSLMQLKSSTPIQMSKITRNSRSPNPQSSLSNIQNLQRSLTKNSNINSSDQKLMQSPLKMRSRETRCKTQISTDDQLSTVSKDALLQLKNSLKTINKSVLPQIKINRQKLNQKMKQKKSFLKSINQRLGVSKQQLKDQLFNRQINNIY